MENGTVGAACIYIENMADLQNKAVNIFAFLLWQSTVVDTLDQNITFGVHYFKYICCSVKSSSTDPNSNF